MVPYVNAVVAVTAFRILLFVLHVCMPRECGGDGNVSVGGTRVVHVVQVLCLAQLTC